MIIKNHQKRHQRSNRHTSLYDLGYFDFEQREGVAKLLEPLGIGKYRPLIWREKAVALEVRLSVRKSRGAINNRAVLLAGQWPIFGDARDIFCGWKEKDENGGEYYCLGIMDEQVTVAGEFYRCRKHSDFHRALKELGTRESWRTRTPCAERAAIQTTKKRVS